MGKPLPSVRVMIDHDVGPNTRDGEIVVYGPNVMRGYHNAPEETARALTPDGGLRTGDLGYIDKDGFLFVTGRIKEQYKLENGRYVVPSPLEAELRASRFIRHVMLCGDGRPHNVALIVPEFEFLREPGPASKACAPTRRELLQHPEVRATFAREIERCSETFRAVREGARLSAAGARLLGGRRHIDPHAEDSSSRGSGAATPMSIDELYGVHRGERAAVD